MNVKTKILMLAFAAAITGGPAEAQTYKAQSYQTQSYQASGEGHRYGNGNTASFFFYDNRDDQRDFPTNGVFPGNFATDPFMAGVGAAGWLGSNPQHQGAPYPSQRYSVDTRGYVACPRYRIEQGADGRRYTRCLTTP